MRVVFAVIMVFSLLFGLGTDRSLVMLDALLKVPENGLTLCLNLVLMASIWNGFLNIASDSGLVERLASACQFLFSRIYPQLPSKDKAIGYIATNFIGNCLGLGSLAMVSGLKAMQCMDELAGHQGRASRSMKTMLIFNTTGFSLFPMTIMTLRAQYQAPDPTDFMPYTALLGLLVLIIGLGLQVCLEKHG